MKIFVTLVACALFTANASAQSTTNLTQDQEVVNYYFEHGYLADGVIEKPVKLTYEPMDRSLFPHDPFFHPEAAQMEFHIKADDPLAGKLVLDHKCHTHRKTADKISLYWACDVPLRNWLSKREARWSKYQGEKEQKSTFLTPIYSRINQGF